MMTRTFPWALPIALLGFASSCASPVPPPEHTLHERALAEVIANPTVDLAPPEIFSVRYRQHEEALAMVARATQTYLEDNGFTVLSASRFQDAWD